MYVTPEYPTNCRKCRSGFRVKTFKEFVPSLHRTVSSVNSALVLSSSQWWTNQYNDVSANKQHAYFSGLFSYNFFIGFLIDLCTRNSLFYFSQNHIQVLIISLQCRRARDNAGIRLADGSAKSIRLRYSLSHLHEDAPSIPCPHDI